MSKGKVITTKERRRYEVLKGPSDTRQIRCTNQKCKNLARQVPDGRGGFTYVCDACGTRFAFSQL